MIDGPPPEAEDVPYRKLFKWGWFVVRGAFGWFLFNTFVSIVAQTLGQYVVQLLATVVSGLRGGGGAEKAGGFLESLVPGDIRVAAVLFAALSFGVILLNLADRALSAWTDALMVTRLQGRLHDKLIDLGPSYHGSHDVGETTVIVTRFTGAAELLLRDLIAFPVVRLFGLVTAVCFLISNLGTIGDTPLWMKLALVFGLLGFPLVGFRLSTTLRAAYGKVRDAELALADEYTNSMSLPMEVQLMGAHRQRSGAFAKALDRVLRTKTRAAVRNEIVSQFEAAAPLVLQALFLVYGVFAALRSSNPGAAGAILAIFYFVPAAVAPVQQMLAYYTGLSSAWPQVESVIEILEAEPDVVESPGARAIDAEARELALAGVTFGYVPGKPVVSRLDFRFKPGAVTAIVARAGMGKSTILNLVARVRDPESGAILLGDRDIKTATFESLRRHVVKVSQFPLFITDTVRENFRLAKADAQDAEIEAVCKKTGMWDVLVHASPPGKSPLDYVLPRAASEGLSGGQRRLLSITRALLLRPKVLLLDEPTTGIDAIGRQLLVPVLRDACAGVTVLLIDHDLDFVAQVAAEVCVLEAGSFTAVGTPAELTERPGLFQRLRQAGEAPAADAS
jgi:ATP-binding cassette, subfamily B, bacterial